MVDLTDMAPWIVVCETYMAIMFDFHRISEKWIGWLQGNRLNGNYGSCAYDVWIKY